MFNRSVPPAKAFAAALSLLTGLLLAASATLELRETALLLPLLAALVGIVGLWRPRSYAGPVTGIVAAGGIAAAQWLFAEARDVAELGLLALVGFAGIGFLAEALARQTEGAQRRQEQDAFLIDELTPTQGAAGALKQSHFERQLADELTRARRYRYPVSLVIIGPDDLARLVEQRGLDGTQPILDELAQPLLRQLRPVDRVGYFREELLAVLLPHTPMAGARVVFDRLRERVKEEQDRNVRAGIAEFPTDGTTPADLTREALAALEFARTADLGLASRDLLASSASL
ncbi:MAG: diguanylate cyclase [Chloroflexi bacterium]|nr:diguanylate cyclase [Chloroflexota bacterium]